MFRPASTGLDHTLLVACGTCFDLLLQVLITHCWLPVAHVSTCFYRSCSHIGGCLWHMFRPASTGLVQALLVACGTCFDLLLQVLFTHCWWPVAHVSTCFYRSCSSIAGGLWHMFRPASTGLVHTLLVACGTCFDLLLQVLFTHCWWPVAHVSTCFYRSCSSIAGGLWHMFRPASTGLVHTLLVACGTCFDLLLQVLFNHCWLPVAHVSTCFYRSCSHIGGCLWHMFRPASTGLDHTLVVACGTCFDLLLQVLITHCWLPVAHVSTYFYRSCSHIAGCLWHMFRPASTSLVHALVVACGTCFDQLLQVLITHWWLPVAHVSTCFYRSCSHIGGCLWHMFRPASTSLVHALVVACGTCFDLLLQVLFTHFWLPVAHVSTCFYKSCSRIGGCLWHMFRPASTGLVHTFLVACGTCFDLLLQVLFTHWWLLVAHVSTCFYRSCSHIAGGLWHMFRPASTGLVHALVVACGTCFDLLLQVLFKHCWLPVAHVSTYFYKS